MSETNNDSNFDTSQWYAIFAGWLFVPIIIAFMRLLGAIIMVIFVNPSQITGLELTIYYGDLISLPILIPTFIMLFLRKRWFPILIIIYFVTNAILTVTYYIKGHNLDVFQLVMSLIWIVYFIRSKRVKATFTA